MNIIGHRGAAGLGLENTETAIRKALALAVPVIEIDTRLTYDKKLILCHDADLERVADDQRRISEHNWAELQSVTLKDGSSILTLEAAMRLIGSTPVIIELKDSNSEYSLLSVLEQFPDAKVSVASFKIPQLAVLRELKPRLPIYASEHTKAVDIVQVGRALKLHGVAMNFWILNPLAYWIARRAGLEIFVYTVNNRFLAWFLRALYPHIDICTDFPDRFLPKPKRQAKAKNAATERATDLSATKR